MGADAKMLGRTRPRCTCSVPGHGMNCEVAHEKAEREKGRPREKQELRREVDCALRGSC
jgi:hypothetical protein